MDLKKRKNFVCHVQETHLRCKDTHGPKVKGREKMFHPNRNPGKPGVTTHISNKVDFETKTVIKTVWA